MKTTKLLLTFLLTTTSLLATNINSEKKLTPDALEKFNQDKITFIDTLSIKSGYSYAITSSTDDNGGVTGIKKTENDGTALAFRLVFNNGYIPYFKPYADFSTYLHEDRNFYLSSIGLRHDFILEKRWIEPYASFGVGYNFTDQKNPPLSGSDAVQTGGGSANFTVEGGVDFYLTEHFALDASLRYDSYNIATTIAGNYTLTTLNERGSLGILLGVVYRFAKDERFLDTDRDGVFEKKDYCPNTPLGAYIDAFGCALDSDKDSVIDLYDECSDTLLGAPVDTKGCALDSDNDTVIDLVDICPNTLPFMPVTQCGCAPYKFDITLNYKYAKYKVTDFTNKPLFNTVKFLKTHKNYRVRLVAFGDDKGSEKSNMLLTQKRVKHAKVFLIEKGIDAKRIRTIARGSSESLVKNDNAKNRAKNRRLFIEFYQVNNNLVK